MDPRLLPRRDLRRLVGEMWTDSRCDSVVPEVLAAASDARVKSCDRAILVAYLRHFPSDHPSFEALRMASADSAERHDWPWRERGRTWRLWDAEIGPDHLSAALLEQKEDAAAVLRQAGLDGDLAQGEYVAEALEAACERAGSARGPAAQALGERLISLYDQMSIVGRDALLAWALLAPWVQVSPPEAYRKRVSRLLVTRIGDPRLSPAAWSAQVEEALAQFGFDLLPAVAALRRWLTEATVRAFFAIVRSTTDRKDQWDQREAFWLAYLDAGLITEAWFAFGRRAEQMAGAMARDDDVKYGRVEGGADPGHSALIMSLGDLRIAEWSHNGACRFWPLSGSIDNSIRSRAGRAPDLYQPVYDGNLLRSTFGPSGFRYLSHHSGWQQHFAKEVADKANVRHPRFGAGL